MSHLIRFTKRARGIVFSLRRAIVAGGRRKLKSSVRRTFYARPRRSEGQKAQHMRAAIYRAALHAANWPVLRQRRYESVTSRYDSFSHFATRFNRWRESRVSWEISPDTVPSKLSLIFANFQLARFG